MTATPRRVYTSVAVHMCADDDCDAMLASRETLCTYHRNPPERRARIREAVEMGIAPKSDLDHMTRRNGRTT